MTQTELDKLTPEAKRIAIATACGWKITQISVYEPNDDVTCTPPGKEVDVWRDAGIGLPDYLNSLDAMHAAEKALQGRYMQYINSLIELSTVDGVCMLWHATAAQRADAFLLVMG